MLRQSVSRVIFAGSPKKGSAKPLRPHELCVSICRPIRFSNLRTNDQQLKTLMSRHLISRATILGTGLIGGSFALALRKFTTDLHISGWDRAEIVQQARSRSAIDDSFTGDLAPALRNADLIFIALPISVTLDILPEIARLAPKHTLVTDACSTKLRIAQAAAENFSASTALFLGGHPMAGREVAGIAQADADL